MHLSDITPLVLTRDEEDNIGRTLSALSWAREVVVVDSFSTDRTEDIARSFPNVRFVKREFDSLAAQSNFGLSLLDSEWALLLDADYVVTDELIDELRSLRAPDDTRAFIAPFRYAVNGRILRASLYPPRVVLLQRDFSKVWQDGHAHRVRVDGDTGMLVSPIIHDDRKPFSRFLERQRKYMRQEAVKLRSTPWRELPWSGRVRRMRVVAPFAVLAQTLFVRGTILDGLPGLRYAFERVVAELMLSRELFR
jgi:glycosyltransferase involved in cell wall biosynthesis